MTAVGTRLPVAEVRRPPSGLRADVRAARIVCHRELLRWATDRPAYRPGETADWKFVGLDNFRFILKEHDVFKGYTVILAAGDGRR